MHSIKSIISLLLIIAVLIFSIQNIAAVEIQFLLWSFSIPRALLGQGCDLSAPQTVKTVHCVLVYVVAQVMGRHVL